MPEFNKNLKVPMQTKTKNMLRRVLTEQDSPDDLHHIKHGLYTRMENIPFTDELRFIRFDKQFEPCVVLQSTQTLAQYYMELEEFQHAMINGKYDSKTQLITDTFAFAKSDQNCFSIIFSPILNTAQKHQLHQDILRETEPIAISMLTSMFNDPRASKEIWAKIKDDVIDRILETRTPMAKTDTSYGSVRMAQIKQAMITEINARIQPENDETR